MMNGHADRAINDIQELYLRLIEGTLYNNLDGERVAGDLRAHRDLWDAAILLRDEVGIMLRDLPGGTHNVDTLYLSTSTAQLEALAQLAEGWEADEMWQPKGDTFGVAPGRACLALWWD